MAKSRKILLQQRWVRLIAAAALCLAFSKAHAVILFRTGDATANTTEPAGDLAGSGWQYEGNFGEYLGTAIAPHFFITAQHIGVPASTFVFRGVNYTIVRWFDDPATDLRIFQVAETFPNYALIYVGNNEVNQRLVTIGRGTQRGGERIVDGQLRGWDWSVGDHVQRWGENQVAGITQHGTSGDLLYAFFDANGLPNESTLSSGDSGGGVFIQENGVWKLAGINYDVDSFLTSSNATPYNAAMFDLRGSYRLDGSLITGDAAVPSAFYATRISSRMAWISSVIAPRLANISARVLVRTGDEVAIGGFIVTGQTGATKRVLIRGLGPSLPVNDNAQTQRLADPVVSLFDSAGNLLATNDNWRSDNASEIQQTGLAPSFDQESALIAGLTSGNYTVVLSGGGANGIGLVEIFDLDDATTSVQLANVSARAYIGGGDDVLIAGLVLESVADRVMVRALGPDLAASGVDGVLMNLVLELHDGNGVQIASNDDWQKAANVTDIIATGLAPHDARDSAILASMSAGAYTAVVRGVGDASGVALLEVYLVK